MSAGGAGAATHVRVKRARTTFFVATQPAETVLELKQKLQVLSKQPVAEQQLQLEDGTVLEDASTVGELKLETDCVLALCFLKGDGEWEEPNIESFEPDEDGEDEEEGAAGLGEEAA